jgi:hypothetical protein
MLWALPKTLDETYERILSAIDAEGQLEDAVRILQWLCFARRPQSLKALVDVLATDTDGNGCFLAEECLPDPFDIITICSSLITVKAEVHVGNIQVPQEAQDPTIQLAHFSVQEYLLSSRCYLSERFSAYRGQSLLAEISLIYTLHVCSTLAAAAAASPEVSEAPTASLLGMSVRCEDKSLFDAYHEYPLFRYACTWW